MSCRVQVKMTIVIGIQFVPMNSSKRPAISD